MEINGFQIKSYGFAELAQMYNPDVTSDAATKRLRNWMRTNEKLNTELTVLGWQKGNRLFTPIQVETIARFLGEP